MINLYRPFSRARLSSNLGTTFPYYSFYYHQTPLRLLQFISIARRQFSIGISNCSSSSSESGENLKGIPCKLEAVRLKSRSLIKLKGPDSLPLLQGLITNDVTHFESKSSIYALFLNNQGRVLWDTILYRVAVTGNEEQTETLIECDSSIKSNLIKHLKVFKLRKKVDIIDVDEGESAVDLWVIFDQGHTYRKLTTEECCGSELQQTSKRADFPVSIGTSLHTFGDPRLNELGWRVFVPRHKSIEFPPKDITVTDESSYKRLRYVLGVAEGVKELPSAGCFPLESNGDYLHGVSFHKGCYIGQELTARSHYTGVIRKRIMPFRLPENSRLENAELGTLQLVTGSGNKSLGKIRGICDSYGIGLIRIEEALSASELKIQDINISLEKPFWWPKEVSKEKITKQ